MMSELGMRGVFDMDLEENLGYRTPFLDIDRKEAETIFHFCP